MDDMFKTRVRDAIRHKPRLVPVFQNVFYIPERLYEYDPRLFICYNAVSERYELHSLEQFDSYCAVIPFKSLDARTLRWVQKQDVRIHGEEIFERMDRHNERLEKSKERDFKRWIEDVASETKSMFAKDAWLM